MSPVSLSDAPQSDALLRPLEMFGMRLGLERVRQRLAALEEPQGDLPAVLVAGTNGKGSTAALLAAMGRAAGYRVGLYTSPHLESVTERIALDGRAIGDAELARYLEEVLEAGDELPTYFEALTLAALRFFREREVELAILEVGLGGRLDATNVCEPILSLITSIALDHERHLGSTLEAIAREKSGILRPGKPAIAWTEDARVENVLRRRADALGARLTLAPQRVGLRPRGPGDAVPQRAAVHIARDVDGEDGIHDVGIHLPGRHQLTNLALAVLAAETLCDLGWKRLDDPAIAAGAEGCRWPGRLEEVTLPDGRRVLLDIAHNPAAARALADFVTVLPAPPGLLFGALEDKTVDRMLPALAAATSRLVLTCPPAGGHAGRGAADLRQWLTLVEDRETVVEPDPRRALDHALAATPTDGPGSRLLVCGSIYLVGAVRRMLRERFGVPDPP